MTTKTQSFPVYVTEGKAFRVTLVGKGGPLDIAELICTEEQLARHIGDWVKSLVLSHGDLISIEALDR